MNKFNQIQQNSPAKRRFIDTIVNRDEHYWKNLVTLRIDISYTDHSHVIGRGGKNTRDVMMRTGCHIHFPDSNKDTNGARSNQVTIAGAVHKVEIARDLLRKSSPIMIRFELKNLKDHINIRELSMNADRLLPADSNVSLVIRASQQDGTNHAVCFVRASTQYKSSIVSTCHNILFPYLFTDSKNVLCTTSIEVLPYDQLYVLGPDCIYGGWISHVTGVKLHYPTRIDALRGASFVYLVGQLDDIMRAREILIGFLPVHLNFDMKANTSVPDEINFLPLEDEFNVQITMQKRSSNQQLADRMISIRSHECNLSNVYNVRNQLLQLNDDVTTLICNRADHQSNDMIAVRQLIRSLRYPMPPSHFNHFSSTTAPFRPSMLAPPPMLHQKRGYAHQQQSLPAGQHQMFSSFVRPTLPFCHTSMENLGILPGQSAFYQPQQQKKQFTMADDQQHQSTVDEVLRETTISVNTISHVSDKQPNTSIHVDSLAVDDEALRQKAFRAMYESPAKRARHPTAQWSGCHFSKTTPSSVHFARRLNFDIGRSSSSDDDDEDDDDDNQQLTKEARAYRDYNGQLFSQTEPALTLGRHLPVGTIDHCRTNLCDILHQLRLDHLLVAFRENEIDMESFILLNEDDLKALGVKTIGARKKILKVIQNLRNRIR